MPEEYFQARHLRLSCKPKLGLNECARKMHITNSYLVDLEFHRRPWKHNVKLRFLTVIREWQANPKPTPRKRYLRPGIGPAAAPAPAVATAT